MRESQAGLHRATKSDGLAEIRKKGRKQRFSAPNFRQCRVYYTLREIGYPSRTSFKRLLAVYSASQILSKLRARKLAAA